MINGRWYIFYLVWTFTGLCCVLFWRRLRSTFHFRGSIPHGEINISARSLQELCARTIVYAYATVSILFIPMWHKYCHPVGRVVDSQRYPERDVFGNLTCSLSWTTVTGKYRLQRLKHRRFHFSKALLLINSSKIDENPI